MMDLSMICGRRLSKVFVPSNSLIGPAFSNQCETPAGPEAGRYRRFPVTAIDGKAFICPGRHVCRYADGEDFWPCRGAYFADRID